MSDAASKPRWYHLTPDRLLIGLLVAAILVLLADRLELLGLTRGSGWNVLLAAAIVCLGLLVSMIWFIAGRLLGRQFRFSLNSIIALTVLVAILSVWFATMLADGNPQKDPIAAIRRLGGEIVQDYETRLEDPPDEFSEDTVLPDWCRYMVGVDAINSRDRWDTPETKLASGRKGRLRKDRYSALVMANMVARQMARQTPAVEFPTIGGTTKELCRAAGMNDGVMYRGPEWFTKGGGFTGIGITRRAEEVGRSRSRYGR